MGAEASHPVPSDKGSPTLLPDELSKFFPGFRRYWKNRSLQHLRVDGSISPCSVFSELCAYFSKKIRTLPAHRLSNFGFWLEEKIGDSEYSAAIKTCFLDNALHQKHSEVLQQHLGEQCLEFLRSWDRGS